MKISQRTKEKVHWGAMSLLYLCEFQNSSGDICLYRYFTRAGKACSRLECVFYRQTIQLLNIKQPELCCIKALPVYSFRLLSNTWLSQARAKLEPSGRCFWGINGINPLSRGPAPCSTSALLCLLPKSHPSRENSEPKSDLLCVSLLEKPRVSLHLLVSPCCAWGIPVCPSGKEMQKPCRVQMMLQPFVLPGLLPLTLNDSMAILELHKRCVIRTIDWYLTWNPAPPTKTVLNLNPPKAHREHLISIYMDTSDSFVLNVTKSPSSGYLIYPQVQKLL